VSAAVDAQSSATSMSVSQDVCRELHSACSSDNHIVDHVHGAGPEMNADTDVSMSGRCGVAAGVDRSDVVSNGDIDDNVGTDVHDSSSLETTLEYSICSDMPDGRISDKCGMQTTVEYYAAESVVDVEEDAVADVRTNAPVAVDIQKPVDLLTVAGSVNVDRRNSPKVCSPPTLMVV